MIEKPTPPPCRIVCEACGELKDGVHTSLICRSFALINRIWTAMTDWRCAHCNVEVNNVDDDYCKDCVEAGHGRNYGI